MKLKVVIILSLFATNALALESEVLLPNRNIKRGESIYAEDFSTQIMNLKSHQNYIQKISNNMRAAKNLESGKPVRKNDVYVDSAVIHKGENVSVQFVRKNLIIELPAIALSNGNVNENVRVKTIDTNKILTGKVMQDGTVHIVN